MSMTDIGPLHFPQPLVGVAVFVNTSLQIRINGTNTAMAFIIQVPKTGTLDKAEFCFASTVDTARDLKVSFRNVDPATGHPDGSIDQYRVLPSASVVANAWAAPGLMTSDGTDGGTKRAVASGDLLAVVVEFDSTVGDVRIASVAKNTSGNTFLNGLHYADLQASGGTWTKQDVAPVLALKYDDGSYPVIDEIVLPVLASTSTTFNNGSVADEIGLYLSLPISVRVAGAWICCDADGPLDIVLYDTDGTSVLASVSLDPDIRPTTSAGTFRVLFTSSVALLVNTTYRLVVKPTSATNVIIYDLPVQTAALMEGLQGGTAIHKTSRVDAGAWTQTATIRPIMGLIIDGIDVSSSVGGAFAYAGMG